MRYAKLLGIALLATMVSVGCGQAPTMNQDIAGYGGHKKQPTTDITQANIIGAVNVGNVNKQNIDQNQKVDDYSSYTYQKQAATQYASNYGDVYADVYISQSNKIDARSYTFKKKSKKPY